MHRDAFSREVPHGLVPYGATFNLQLFRKSICLKKLIQIKEISFDLIHYKSVKLIKFSNFMFNDLFITLLKFSHVFEKITKLMMRMFNLCLLSLFGMGEEIFRIKLFFESKVVIKIKREREMKKQMDLGKKMIVTSKRMI